MKYKLLFILSCFTILCKGQVRDSEDLCAKLVKMYEQDQLYREMEEVEDPFFRVFDSIRHLEGISREDYMKYSKNQQLEYGKRIRGIVNEMNLKNQNKLDSLMMIQKKIDIQNTRALLDIISKDGFPDFKKLNCDGYAAPFLIFVHSPEEFWSEIETAIKKELKYNRMTTGDYEYIMWHLKGRKGMPF